MSIKTKLIISILIILIITLAVGTAVLYFTTDLFKTNEYIFQKYFLQNFTNISNTIDVKKEGEIIEYILKKDYIVKTDGTLAYKEKENDEEEIYNITEQGAVNNTKATAYRRIKTNFEDEELLNLDILNRDGDYGFKLTNVEPKFIVMEKPIDFLLESVNSDLQELKLNNIDISKLFGFSADELAQMKNKYLNVFFQGIDGNAYSKKKNVMITLNNGISVTTTKYILKLSQTDVNKIYKRVLNQITEDENIILKLEEVEKILNQKGIKEQIISNIKKTADSIEYSGQNDKEFSIEVFVSNKTMVRTTYKTPDIDYVIDYDYSHGITVSLQTIKLTNEGEDKKVYSLNKLSDSIKNFEYKDSTKLIKLNYEIKKDEEKADIKISFTFNSEDINELKLDLDTNIDFANAKDFQNSFNNQNSIFLSDYEENEVEDILNELGNKKIEALEEKQEKINTKLLNNVLLWIDNRKNIKNQEEINKQNDEKIKFNNTFNLYEGENISSETILKLLDSASQNLKDFQVLDEKNIKLLVEPNYENEEMSKKIADTISKKYTYNVKIEYDSKGYINVINISIYEKKK